MSLCNCSTLTFTSNNMNCKGHNNVSNLYGNGGLMVNSISNKINNLVMLPSSLHNSNKTSKVVGCATKEKCKANGVFVTNNQSDQVVLSKSIAFVPTRGNSLRSTITSLRPGALTPGGIGVDVKHGSYARYLALKKGKLTN